MDNDNFIEVLNLLDKIVYSCHVESNSFHTEDMTNFCYPY